MSNVRFMYLRNEQGVPVACVAYQLATNGVSFGLSVHNVDSTDGWDRKVARYMAAGALLLTPDAIGLDSSGQATHVIADIIAHSGRFPTRAKKAAKVWLRTSRWNAPCAACEPAPVTERNQSLKIDYASFGSVKSHAV